MKLMKIKIKVIYENEVKPTKLADLSMEDPSDIEEMRELILNTLDEVLDDHSNVKGLFISRD